MKKDKCKAIILIIFLTLTDQIIKFAIILNKEYMPITVIKSMLQFSYVENYGIAFGIATGSKIIFIIANIIIIGIILKFLFTQEVNLNKSKKVLLIIIASGGLGNLIDRIFRGFVVDYIDFTQMINYPVFNLADIMIVIGIIGFAILIVKDMINENNVKDRV